MGTLLLSLSTYAAMNVNKIDPPFWYTGMQNPELQLMVYGEGIGNAAVSVNYPGVSLSSTVKLESNNYELFKAYIVTWNLTDNGGRRLRPGVYLYRAAISTNNSKEATKANKLIILAQ